jgi:6-phosphogluconolactonase/glucosamine-6-phosphate isomerase/deaminase
MRFIKVTTGKPVARDIADKLTYHLQRGERVLWLISGGSVIKLAVLVAQQLQHQDLSRLTVSLTDERPGPLGHPDSNWLGLMDAGFELHGANLQPVLTGEGTRAEAAGFNRFLREQLERNDFKLGLFGIGPDGHTAGLPAQNAAESDKLADYYEAGAFHRISSTPAAIARLDEIVAFVMGENKHGQLERLEQDLPYGEQSAQTLKQVANLTIFNDYQGESPS